MATDLTLYLEDHPGELARLGEVLGGAGVNIEGFCAVTSGGGSAEVHVCVHDLEGSLRALEADGVKVANEQEVIVLDVEDRPGALGEIAKKLGDSSVNITLAYLATDTRLVLGADDFAAALAALRD